MTTERLQNYVTLAFYKNDPGVLHKIIRWWTGSIYSHAELILPDGITWVSISPLLNSRVTLRVKPTQPDQNNWDYVRLYFSPREKVRDYQIKQLYKFVEQTQMAKYDWIGMLLSQALPFLIKRRGQWYCSQWIAYALIYSKVVMWDDMKVYDTPDMSPGKLYDIVYDYIPEHYK